MQASSVKEPFDSPDWISETKLDGYRAIAVIDATGNARIWSRNHLPLEPKFPTVADAVNQLNLRSTILDGEIVALDKDGIPWFQLLQQWQKCGTYLGRLARTYPERFSQAHTRNGTIWTISPAEGQGCYCWQPLSMIRMRRKFAAVRTGGSYPAHTISRRDTVIACFTIILSRAHTRNNGETWCHAITANVPMATGARVSCTAGSRMSKSCLS